MKTAKHIILLSGCLSAIWLQAQVLPFERAYQGIPPGHALNGILEYYPGGFFVATEQDSGQFGLCRFDEYGDPMWMRSYATSEPVAGRELIFSAWSPYLYIVGESGGTQPQDEHKAMVMKIDTAGQVIWCKTYTSDRIKGISEALPSTSGGPAGELLVLGTQGMFRIDTAGAVTVCRNYDINFTDGVAHWDDGGYWLSAGDNVMKLSGYMYGNIGSCRKLAVAGVPISVQQVNGYSCAGSAPGQLCLVGFDWTASLVWAHAYQIVDPLPLSFGDLQLDFGEGSGMVLKAMAYDPADSLASRFTFLAEFDSVGQLLSAKRFTAPGDELRYVLPSFYGGTIVTSTHGANGAALQFIDDDNFDGCAATPIPLEPSGATITSVAYGYPVIDSVIVVEDLTVAMTTHTLSVVPFCEEENGIVEWSEGLPVALVFPDPTSGPVQLQGIAPNELVSLEVFSSDGRSVHRERAHRGGGFDLSPFNPGTYVIVAGNEDRSFKYRCVLSK